MKTSIRRDKVFVSYSHKDAAWLERFKVHLKPLEREGRIVLWDDTGIKAGDKWRTSIEQGLTSAKAAVLLVSADFLASDFISANELPRLLSAAESEGAIILPLIVKPCRFQQTAGLSEFQAVNSPSEPLISMTESDSEQTFVMLANRISEIFALENVEDKNAASTDDDLIEAESQEEEVFHPSNRLSNRSALQPCKFFISPFYAKGTLWNLYADVLVELKHAAPDEKVFMIPSGAVNPYLRDTHFLRTEQGSDVLAKKQQATIAFVELWKNLDLDGYRFVMKTNNGEDRKKVYCAAYDRFLNEAFNNDN